MADPASPAQSSPVQAPAPERRPASPSRGVTEAEFWADEASPAIGGRYGIPNGMMSAAAAAGSPDDVGSLFGRLDGRRARGLGLQLQRTIGNRQVLRFIRPPASMPSSLQREGAVTPGQPAAAAPVPNTVPPRVDYVFLMNVQNDNFYKNAEGFFKASFPAAVLVKDKKTLADVLGVVNSGGKVVRNLFLVSHANEEGNLGFSLNAADLAKDQASGDTKLRTEFKEIKDANAKPGALPTADVKLIDAQTKVEIKGCNIGRSQRMLKALSQAFGGQAAVVAPTHKQGYRSRTEKGVTTFSEEFDTYFIEETGLVANKKPAELLAAFSAKYPSVPKDKWAGLIGKVKYDPAKRPIQTRTDLDPPADDQSAAFAFFELPAKFPASQGWALTYKGRTASADTYTYKARAERVLKDGSTAFQDLSRTVPIPMSDADFEAFARENSGRPDSRFELEKKTQGKNMIRTVYEERTVWSIAGTIVDSTGAIHPPETDKTFYGSQAAAPPPTPPKPPTP